MQMDSKIYVAGHTGLVGSAIVRSLERKGYKNLIYRTHSELDLTNQTAVWKFFEEEKPEYVFLAAAKVGGIIANATYPANYIMENLLIECNVIKSSFEHKVKKLLCMGSSCIYPKACPQPIKEEYLLSAPLETTNEAYALAKIAGIKMCHHFNKQYGTQYITVMPASIYGIQDRFDIHHSHVIPALIMKMHDAKISKKDSVTLWGTGTPLREFLYVDDLADACTFLMETYEGQELLNIGTGHEISIKELAETIKKIVGFDGELIFDTSKPDGTLRKVLDSTKIAQMGWKPKVMLEEGIRREYEYYLNHVLPPIMVSKWFEDNGDNTLRVNYELDQSSIVFDLGGNIGEWSEKIYEKYKCNIWIFEPVPDFSDLIKQKFRDNPKITINEFGLADYTGTAPLYVNGVASSLYRATGTNIMINLMEAGRFIEQHNITNIDLIKINIEGGEYDLLDHLLDTGYIKIIKNIQVQFHQDFPNAESRMISIQERLAATHYLTYQYWFVFENWEKR